MSGLSKLEKILFYPVLAISTGVHVAGLMGFFNQPLLFKVVIVIQAFCVFTLWFQPWLPYAKTRVLKVCLWIIVAQLSIYLAMLPFSAVASEAYADGTQVLGPAEPQDIARMVPTMDKKGKVDGFMLVTLEKGSVFEKFGLKKGDVIKGYNGKKINHPERLLEFYNLHQKANFVELEILRNGKSQRLSSSLL